MSVTLQKFPITVKATADWSVAANAWADIEPVLMDILPVTFPLNAAITFVILEGEEDEDDVGKLSLATNDTPSWSTAFSSYPSAGQFVYIVGIAI